MAKVKVDPSADLFTYTIELKPFEDRILKLVMGDIQAFILRIIERALAKKVEEVVDKVDQRKFKHIQKSEWEDLINQADPQPDPEPPVIPLEV